VPTARHLAGPHHPVPTVPARAPGSIRRTTTIDSDRPDGPEGSVLVDARGRDLLTTTDGRAVVVGEQRIWAELESMSRVILSIGAEPAEPRLQAVVGAAVGPGFRGTMTKALDDLSRSGGLLYLLLDDWPGANLVSGYAMQRVWLENEEAGQGTVVTVPGEHIAAMADICSGWSHDSPFMVMVQDIGNVPTPMGPLEPAGSISVADDPLAFHDGPPRPARSTRRARRIDVMALGDGRFGFDAHFRDSHAEPDGGAMVVHEYSATGTFDHGTGVIESIDARPLVLPWDTCPAAIASANRIVGMTAAELRTRVRNELVGPSTCTHLNDTLRELADIDALATRLAHQIEADPS
jgi:hypothetical protein